MSALEGKNLCQISLVVKDIEKTAAMYAKLLGVEVPPITTCPPPEIAHTTFLGEPTATQARLCNFQINDHLVLELTECDEYPSTWKDFLEKHGQGVHHLGFACPDRDATIQELEDNGMKVRHYGEYPGGNYTVIDSEEQLGVYLNIKPMG